MLVKEFRINLLFQNSKIGFFQKSRKKGKMNTYALLHGKLKLNPWTDINVFFIDRNLYLKRERERIDAYLYSFSSGGCVIVREGLQRRYLLSYHISSLH